MRPSALIWAAALTLAACDNSTRTITPPSPDAWIAPDASAGPEDAGPPTADAARPVTPDAALDPLGCAEDRDCAGLAWCDEGHCQLAPEAPSFQPPDDAVFRAAAARFDLSPDYLEGWQDRAGPDCPGNRPGLFDGRLSRATPFDECADGFEDSDGDGVFDAAWTAGGLDRPAAAIDLDNPPAGRVLILGQGADLWVLITLDGGDIAPGRLAQLTRRLRLRLGLPESRIAVHTTGNPDGPDLSGLAGPSLAVVDNPWAEVIRTAGPFPLLDDLPFAASLGDAWWATIEARCEAAVSRAGLRLKAARMRWGHSALPMGPDPAVDGPLALPDVDQDGLMNTARDRAADLSAPRWLARDLRWPSARDHRLRVLRLEGLDGGAVAQLMLWGTTPQISAQPGALSGGLPGAVREAVEAQHPELVALWLTGAVSGAVVTDSLVQIPARDEAGRLLDADGAPVDDLELAAPVPEGEAFSALTRLLVDHAEAALAETDSEAAEMILTRRYGWLPITNPRIGLAARLGLLPALGRWLSGRETTTRWASGIDAPACGGLGCLRHRLDQLQLGPLTLITLPGAPSGAYSAGRGEGSVFFEDALSYTDLDTDGTPDAEDLDLPVGEPANPQRLAPVVGLGGDRTWLIGRTGGGFGSLLPKAEAPNVFEGQLDPLRRYVADEVAGALDLCAAAYPCAEALTLGALVEISAASQMDRLADLPGGHTLWLISPPPRDRFDAQPWRLYGDEDALLAEGHAMIRLPEGRAFSLEVDFNALSLAGGERLEIADEAYTVGGVSPLVLARHPNAATLWASASASWGALIYNTACELKFDGLCPHRQGLPGADPHQILPRTPQD